MGQMSTNTSQVLTKIFVASGDRQLSRLQRFVQLTEEVDVTDVGEQYAMVSSTLGDAVRKSLQDVMAFRRSLVEERLRFHGEQLRSLEEFRRGAMNELKELEGRRAALLRSVGEDTGTSLQGAFARLAKRQVEVECVSS